MNIIKFKDTIRLGDELFNKYLKGKYAHFIHMRYAVPLEFVTVPDYINFENNICALTESNVPYWDMQKADLVSYVDEARTDEANDINTYIRHNKYSTDSDITEDEVRRFRTWLAKSLLEFDQNNKGVQQHMLYNESFTYILQYYAGGMYNEVIKRLSEIHKISTPTTFDKCGSIQPALNKMCGCGVAAQPVETAVCDPMASYRSYVHDVMVSYFSEIHFWQQMPVDFLAVFKQYIDNIVRMGLPLYNLKESEKYLECGKLSEMDQHIAMKHLGDLSKAIGYIMEDDIFGHRNFISDALIKWSTDLYEKMQWAK